MHALTLESREQSIRSPHDTLSSPSPVITSIMARSLRHTHISLSTHTLEGFQKEKKKKVRMQTDKTEVLKPMTHTAAERRRSYMTVGLRVGSDRLSSLLAFGLEYLAFL